MSPRDMWRQAVGDAWLSRHVVSEDASVALELPQAAHALEHELHTAGKGKTTTGNRQGSTKISETSRPVVQRGYTRSGQALTPPAGEDGATS